MEKVFVLMGWSDVWIGDVLRVDPNIIPKIFQVLYDSEGQTALNNSSSTMSNSMIQSQVRFRVFSLRSNHGDQFNRIKIVILAKPSNTKVIVLLWSPIVCQLNVKHAIVHAITFSLHLPVWNVHGVMFVVINNITMIEKNSCYHVEVRTPVRITLTLCFFLVLVNDKLSVKELLVMCASENEQKQWIAKLSKKIPKRGIVSQHDQTTSSRFVSRSFSSFSNQRISE